MPLTPEDVENTRFTTVRLREGYDMQEVDLFLDEVQEELARLHRENDDLRDKLAAVMGGGTVAPVQADVSAAESSRDTTTSRVEPIQAEEPEQAEQVEEPAEEQNAPEPEPATTVQAPEPAPEPVQASTPVVAVPPGASGGSPERAFDILTYAQRTADQLVADARAESERLLTDARQRAEKLDEDSRSKATRLEREAKERSENLDRETDARRHELFDKLDAEKEKLDRQLETLRSFEREYRSRLKIYLENELRKLESVGVEGAAPGPMGGQRSVGLLDDNNS